MASTRPAARGFAVRRIMVALDSSSHAQAALEAAAALAARLEAELEGLFVEDVNLMRLAELPIAREVRFTGPSGPITAAAILEQIEGEAARLRQALLAAAGHTQARASFSRIRGEVAAEVVAASARTDLLILGLAGGAAGRGGRPGSTALAAAQRSARPVLIMRPGMDLRRTALVPYDGSAAADAALAAAALLALDRREALTVVLRADDEAAAERLRARAAAVLAELDQPARFQLATAPSLVDLCRMAAAAGASVMVLHGEDALLQDDGYEQLLTLVRCSVLLLR